MPTIPYKNSQGQRVSGVTTIISSNLAWNKQQLMYWAWNEGMEGRNYKETVQKAADAGSIAHARIEAYLKGKEYHYPKDAELTIIEKASQAYENFVHWKDTVGFRAIALEEHLVSEVYQYGATPDCIAEINGKTCLFDWKSSSGVYADHMIQLSAYKMAWDEVHGEMLLDGGFYLYRMDKDTAAWTLHYWQDLPEAWEAFKCLLRLHQLKKLIKP